MNSIVIFSLILLLCSGCSIPPFKPTAHNNKILLEVVISDNIIWKGKKRKGLSKCVAGFCKVWLPPIKTLDDDGWCTWGKELGHAYYGEYHKGFEDIY